MQIINPISRMLLNGGNARCYVLRGGGGNVQVYIIGRFLFF